MIWVSVFAVSPCGEQTVEEKVLHTEGLLNPGHLQKIWCAIETFLCVAIIKHALAGDILEMLLVRTQH